MKSYAAMVALIAMCATPLFAGIENVTVKTNELSSYPLLVYVDKSQYTYPEFTNEYVRFNVWFREVGPLISTQKPRLVIIEPSLGKVFDGRIDISNRDRQGIPLLDFMVSASSLASSYVTLYLTPHMYQGVDDKGNRGVAAILRVGKFKLGDLYEANRLFDTSSYVCSTNPADEKDQRFLQFMNTEFEAPTNSPTRLGTPRKGAAR